MKRALPTLPATAGALIGWCLGYTAPAYLHLPSAFYDPIARTWSFTEHASPIAMGYFGQVLYGVGGAIVVGAIVGAMAPQTPRARTLLTGWSLTGLALSLLYFTWHNWP